MKKIYLILLAVLCTFFVVACEVFIEPTTYTVTFDANGTSATSMPAVQTVIEGAKASEPKDPEMPAGKAFAGWYKEASCTTEFDFDAAITENTVIYASSTDAEPAPGLEFDDSTVKGQVLKAFYKSLDLPVHNVDYDSPTDIEALCQTLGIMYNPTDVKSISVNHSISFDISAESEIKDIVDSDAYHFDSFTVEHNISGTIKMAGVLSEYDWNGEKSCFTSCTNQNYQFIGNVNGTELSGNELNDVELEDLNGVLVVKESASFSFKSSRPEGMTGEDETELFNVLGAMKYFSNNPNGINVNASNVTEQVYDFVSPDTTLSLTETSEYFGENGKASITVYNITTKVEGRDVSGVITSYNLSNGPSVSFGIVEIDGDKFVLPMS